MSSINYINLNLSLNAILDEALLNTEELLNSLTWDSEFSRKVRLAFGDSIDVVTAESLVRELAKPNSSALPKFEIRDESEINGARGARGAFAGATNTIYLSRQFLGSNNIPEITAVLLEEIGHAIDWRLNGVDTPGDEGELFSALVRGVELSDGELQRIKTEDDSAVVTIDGNQLQIEQGNYNLGLVEGTETWNHSIFYGDQDYFVFQISSTGKSDSLVGVASESESVDLILELYNQSGNLLLRANENDYTYNLESLYLTGLPAGTYVAKVYDYYGGQYVYPYSASYTLGINGPQAFPDLTPHKPSGWSDKLVISTQQGTKTDANQITTNDTLYIDWSYLNQGTGKLSNSIGIRLLLDGTVVNTWTDNWSSTSPLNSNVSRTPLEDFQIAPLSAGNHKLRLEIDYLNQASETNENNNVYEKTFTVIAPALPDLTPYKFGDWDDKLVISTTTGNRTNATQITTNSTLYIDYAFTNQGNSATSKPFSTRLLLDGNVVIHTYNWTASINPNQQFFYNDLPIAPLSAGEHTLELIVDVDNQAPESNESNNSYKRTFTVIAPAVSDLTPYKPGSWDDKLVVSTVKGTSTNVTLITPSDTIYVDWAFINQGTGATSKKVNTQLLLDGAVLHTWFIDPPLDANFYSYVTDFSLGSLSAGTHTLKLVVDHLNAEAETNENNNIFEKVFTVKEPINLGRIEGEKTFSFFGKKPHTVFFDKKTPTKSVWDELPSRILILDDFDFLYIS